MHTFFQLLLCLTLSFSLFGQEYPNQSPLELREIMKGPDFIGHLPENVHWSLDGKQILFDWNPQANPGNQLYAYGIASQKTVAVFPEFYKNNGDYSSDGLLPVHYYSENGALMAFDRKLNTVQQIYRSANYIRNVQMNTENNRVYFQEGEELKLYNTKDKCIETIFVFKNGEKPSANAKADHWTEEEAELFQFIKDENETEAWNKKQAEIWKNEIPSYYYGSEHVENVQVSPDGNFLTFRLHTRPATKGTHVENHISKDGHSYASNARSKVSDLDPSNRLAIYDLQRDTVYFVDFGALTDIRKKPEYYKDYGDMEPLFEKDRALIMHEVTYADGSNLNALDVRSYDNKDRWIVSLDLKTGHFKELERQHDEAWIGGPGISGWNMVPGTLGWLKDGKTVYFQSEETGYSHVYTLDTKSGKKTALTSGNWEVHEVALNQAGTTFYLTTNQTHPGNRSFYHLDVASKKLTPILVAEGAFEVSVSPDEKMLAVRYSGKANPWEVYVAPNKENAALTQITHSTTKQFSAYSWYEPSVIQFKASDGVLVSARIYDPKPDVKNGAAILFVHGAGYLQNAHNWWSTYSREYMFHNLLRDNGFTVLDIDYRASEGYGRDFRTGIYRQMGGKDLSDQMDGRQLLIDSLGIDPNKIGMYGGSYGGFITLMALLTEPGKFQAGAAIRSVTDWYHYNHEYTSNILNYPTSDTLAYERSSPIYYANNLQDRLLMLHGMVDDNVQFQDVVRLSERFIELEKRNWELAVFPVEAHGFQKSYSWTDEYRRIYELFYDELLLKKK